MANGVRGVCSEPAVGPVAEGCPSQYVCATTPSEGGEGGGLGSVWELKSGGFEGVEKWIWRVLRNGGERRGLKILRDESCCRRQINGRS